MRRRRFAPTLPYYVGAFLGPFGGPIIVVLFPQLQAEFGASTGAVALAIPAYLIPFAALQLISGTLAEALGRRRVVRTAYVLYAVFSFALAVAPSLDLFLALRACQGAANAFFTPILLAGLADVTPQERLGRSMGTFAAVQTAAVASAPLFGGLAGEIDWRLAVVLPGVVALLLAVISQPPGLERAQPHAVRLRAVVTRRVARLAGAAFTAHMGITGISFLVAIQSVDVFALGSTERGLVVAGFGIAGMMVGRSAGGRVDREGARPVVVTAALVCGGLVAVLGLVESLALFAAAWIGAGVCSAFLWAGMNKLMVESVPRNRAGATSVVFAFKFAGQAAAPLAWLPLYDQSAALGFAAAACTGAITGLLILPLRGDAPAGTPVGAEGDARNTVRPGPDI